MCLSQNKLASSAEFPLFETIAVIDRQFQQLAYHQQRMDKAMQGYFGVENPFKLAEILAIPDDLSEGLVRCKVAYNERDFHVQFFAYQPREIRSFHLVHSENLDYRFKYSDRRQLDALKNAHCDEVIIIHHGFVSDCTIGNLLFLKQGMWYSPTHYLLKGTQLTQLIEQGKVTLVEIREQDLPAYEQIMLINALNPFDPARAVPISAITSG